jgi:hypothetical protein
MFCSETEQRQTIGIRKSSQQSFSFAKSFFVDLPVHFKEKCNA